ncbi:hypothetical protein ACKFKF_08325 [Phormidesmis sp. 146-12]
MVNLTPWAVLSVGRRVLLVGNHNSYITVCPSVSNGCTLYIRYMQKRRAKLLNFFSRTPINRDSLKGKQDDYDALATLARNGLCTPSTRSDV